MTAFLIPDSKPVPVDLTLHEISFIILAMSEFEGELEEEDEDVFLSLGYRLMEKAELLKELIPLSPDSDNADSDD